MEKHCTMVYFSLRESKQNKKGLSPIEVSITTNGKRIYFSTGKHVPAADWNKEKQAVKGKSEEAQLINGYLIQLRNKIYQKEIELLQKGYLITAELLKEAITDKVEALNEKTLLNVLNEHNTERKAMVGKTVAPATYWVFEYTGRLFKGKPPVIHVFSATLSISIFVPQNEAYDDTRRSCRNYYVLQGTQSNL